MTMRATTGPFLRKAGFFLCAAIAAAAALSPDWLTRLKAEGYYGDVDMRLELTAPPTLEAGRPADFLVTARNLGPGDAHRPRAFGAVQGDLHFSATSGCIGDPAGFPQCYLPGPLPADAQEDYLLHADVSPTARGEVQFAVALTSDDSEVAPGDEIQVYRTTIEANADLQAAVACAPVRVGRAFPCYFTFRNNGPATSLDDSMSAYVHGGDASVTWQCHVLQGSLACPALAPGPIISVSGVTMQPGDTVQLRADIIIASHSTAYEQYFAGLAEISQSSGERDFNPADNYIRHAEELPLFADDFEASDAPANR